MIIIIHIIILKLIITNTYIYSNVGINENRSKNVKRVRMSNWQRPEIVGNQVAANNFSWISIIDKVSTYQKTFTQFSNMATRDTY